MSEFNHLNSDEDNFWKLLSKASPPAVLPVYRNDDDWNEVSFFGESYPNIESSPVSFGLKREDRRQHLYIVGKTGVGKSKMIELLIQADIMGGKGACVIDPHGDLFQNLLDYIPENRLQDVVIIDPTDNEFPVCFNPLLNTREDSRHIIAAGLIEVFRKQFGAQWTPRLEHVCRFTILALLEYGQATFADVMRMLTDAKFRQAVIPKIGDEVVRKFWTLEFSSWSERFDNEAITPLVNRMGQFLANPFIRNIFSHRVNKIDFDQCLKESKIILVNLSKGILGEENTELFGSLIITTLYQSVMRRAKLSERERKDFYLYVDEFQNVATQTFLNLFSESRKYGLSITISHQYLGQITQTMRDTIFGNVGTMISFRVGGEDAERLTKEYEPVFINNDLLNLSKRSFVIKIMVDGQVFDPFPGTTLDVFYPAMSFKDKIYDISREKYSVPLGTLKKELEIENKVETSDFSGAIL